MVNLRSKTQTMDLRPEITERLEKLEEKYQEVVKRNIDSDKAVDALIDLIKVNGDWVEKA